jgi:cell division protein FtsQ
MARQFKATCVSSLVSPQTAVVAERPRWITWILRTVFALLACGVLSAPWWGPPTLSRLDYFRIRRVEFEGVRYVNPSELLARMAMDSTASIFNDLDALAARVAQHPMVLSVDITRTLPSSIVVSIVERVPVALVPMHGELTPVDAMGHDLPIDPTRHIIDTPIVATADTTILRFLDGLRTADPAMYARVIEVRRVNRQEWWMQLKGIAVRTRDDVTVGRLGDILRVEESLAQQKQHAVELDLRFQDQVIARLP